MYFVLLHSQEIVRNKKIGAHIHVLYTQSYMYTHEHMYFTHIDSIPDHHMCHGPVTQVCRVFVSLFTQL